jgi:hypothetical protein
MNVGSSGLSVCPRSGERELQGSALTLALSLFRCQPSARRLGALGFRLLEFNVFALEPAGHS